MVQVNNTPIVLRLHFKKIGRLQYVSHLDLVRTMHKVIVRAGLPLKYTEGFNPKPKMVFAAPLSIGTESLVEFVDIRLSRRMDIDEAKRRLNDNMAKELQVVSAYYPETKLTDLKWLSYTVIIKTTGQDAALAEACERTLLSDEVMIEKRSKSGSPVTLNIRPLIRCASSAFTGDAIRINCILSADASAFLNPEHVIKALRLRLGILSADDLTTEYYSIMREEAYREDMSIFR